METFIVVDINDESIVLFEGTQDECKAWASESHGDMDTHVYAVHPK